MNLKYVWMFFCRFAYICVFYGEIINVHFANIYLLVVNYFSITCKSQSLIPARRNSNGYRESLSKSGSGLNYGKTRSFLGEVFFLHAFALYERHVDWRALSMHSFATRARWHGECDLINSGKLRRAVVRLVKRDFPTRRT